MATESFDKVFYISQQETIDKLEQAMQNLKPINVDLEQYNINKIRSEQKLLNILRSKSVGSYTESRNCIVR